MISRSTLAKLYNGDAFTYVAFGDSVTYGARCQGWVDTYGETWTSGSPSSSWNSWANRLSRWLTLVNPNVTFVNAGYPGDKASDGIARITDVTSHNPDLTTVQFGLNDANGGVSTSTYEANLQTIIDDITTGEVVLMTPTLEATTSNKYGWLWPTLSDPATPLSDYAASVRSIAATNSLQVVDLYRMLSRQHNWGLSAMVFLNNQGASSTNLDGEHPGEMGHSMVFAEARHSMFGPVAR